MRLIEVVELLDAKVICGNINNGNVETFWAVAADLMSNIMLDAPDDCLLITGLVNPQVVRTAEMMNVKGIILVKGKKATNGMIALAEEKDIIILEADVPMFVACGKLYANGLSGESLDDKNPVLKKGLVSEKTSDIWKKRFASRLEKDWDHIERKQHSKTFHSVILDPTKCNGCTHCVQGCPTEAIRIRKGRAIIISERCIDCGHCIKVCPQHAKKSITDSIDLMKVFKYKVVIPASAILGQFREARSRNHLLTAILNMGFDDIFEEANAAEVLTVLTKQYIDEGKVPKPAISSACPAITKLIQVLYPNLIDHLLPFESPMELAARMAKDKIVAQGKAKREDIGVFFLTPCVAKAANVKETLPESRSEIDAIIQINDVFLDILKNLQTIKDEDILNLSEASILGIRWAKPGGESLALGIDNFLAVDGIENAVEIFKQLEDDKLEDIDFVEALACTEGCLGGPLTVENVYVARTNMKKMEDEAKETYNVPQTELNYPLEKILQATPFQYKPVMQLDSDLEIAMNKMEEMNKIIESLPGIDCGACGAPTCKALAEDIVRGKASRTNCLFKMWDVVKSLEDKIDTLESK